VLRTQLALDPHARRIPTMVAALRDLGVEQEAQAEVQRLADAALDQLHRIDPSGVRVGALRNLAVSLIDRTA